MAVDTRAKRASVLGLCAAVVLTLPAPDATVGQDDRQHTSFCYSGLTASAAVIATAEVIMTPSVTADIIDVRGLLDMVRVRGVAEIVTVEGSDVVQVVQIQETVKL